MLVERARDAAHDSLGLPRSDDSRTGRRGELSYEEARARHQFRPGESDGPELGLPSLVEDRYRELSFAIAGAEAIVRSSVRKQQRRSSCGFATTRADGVPTREPVPEGQAVTVDAAARLAGGSLWRTPEALQSATTRTARPMAEVQEIVALWERVVMRAPEPVTKI